MEGSIQLAEGMRVGGKYVLSRALARGSMGEVWVARHETLEGELAIKFMSRLQPGPDAEDETTAMARFRFEAQVAAKLARKSRHIVAVTDHGEEGGWAYLVMELVEGDSLDAAMRREQQLPLSLVADVVAQIAKGLTQAHAEGVFHRDLKPANVLLTRDEDGAVLAKILDFGIAKTVKRHQAAPAPRQGARPGPGHETEAGIVLGTPNYMSPEQARGLSSLDHRCDVWALSVIAYEALTGALPYDGETTADLLVNICTTRSLPARGFRADLPAAIEPVFERAFAAKVEARFQSASDLAEALTKTAANASGIAAAARVPVGSLRPAAAGATSAASTQMQLEPVQAPSMKSGSVRAPDGREAAVVRPITRAAEPVTTGAMPPVPTRGRWVPWAIALVLLLLVVGVGVQLLGGGAARDPASEGSVVPTSTEKAPASAPTIVATPASAVPTPLPSSAVLPVAPTPTMKQGKPPPGATAKATTEPPTVTAPSVTVAPPTSATAPKKPVDKGEIL